LAYIVRAIFPDNIGRIVTVIERADQHADLGVVWLAECQSPLRVTTEWGGVSRMTTTTAFCHDADLRPIRDHGPDAVGETLLWLPVPVGEVVAA